MSKRTRARELVLKCLYAHESLGGDAEEIFERTAGKSAMESENRLFAKDLFTRIVSRRKRIDKEIGKHAENWDFERFAVVDKNILRIAVCELFFFPDIPARASINEAIELAKKYSTMESASFVNGILDAVFHSNIKQLQEGGKLIPNTEDGN